MKFLTWLGDLILPILNFLFFRKSRAAKLEKAFLDCIESGLVDEFLYLMLKLMSLILLLDKDYRRNIKDFNASYQFTDKSGEICVGAVFRRNRLKVTEKKLKKPIATLIFKDGASLINFLLFGSGNILNAMLNQEIDFSGNINYINKFAFMALHLLLSIKGEAIL
jgi:hypothetical protein